jgi:membrane protein YqaA with SNARE-associated domain
LQTISEYLHRIKIWVEQYAQKPSAAYILFLFAVVESSCFPLSPDFLNIPLSIARPKRAFWYATICIVGSVIGGLIGYHIGAFLFESFGQSILSTFGWTELFDSVLLKYNENAWQALVLAGFTPIPFEVFTFAAGFNHTIDLITFTSASFIGRCVRFYLIAALLYFFGPAVKIIIDKYLIRTTVFVTTFFIVWLLATKFLF